MDLGIRVNPALQRMVRSKTDQTETDGVTPEGRGDEARENAAHVLRREGGEYPVSRKRKAEGSLDAWVMRGEAIRPWGRAGKGATRVASPTALTRATGRAASPPEGELWGLCANARKRMPFGHRDRVAQLGGVITN